MSALGQKRTFAAQNVMSALLPKADMCGATKACPLCANSGHRGSLDQPVSDLLNVQRHFEAERLGSLEIDQ